MKKSDSLKIILCITLHPKDVFLAGAKVNSSIPSASSSSNNWLIVFLNQKETKDGNKKYYVRYLLKNATTGQKDEMLAHVLVWKLFGDYPIPEDGVVHHISGDSLDNRLINLQALTKEEHDKIAGGFQLGVERKVVDSSTFARDGHDFPFTKMKYFERRDDAAKYLDFLENGSREGLTSAELAGVEKADALLVSRKVEYEDVWDLRNAGDLLESRVVQEKD